MSKELCIGADVIHKKYRGWKCGRIISYHPSTGTVVVQQGAGAWAAHEDEVEVVREAQNDT